MYLWSLEMPYQGLWQRCDVTLWGLCAVFYEGSLGMYRLSSISRPLFLPKATACIQVREMDKMLSPMSRERASLLHPVLVSFHVNESHLHKTPTLSSSSLIPTWCWGWRRGDFDCWREKQSTGSLLPPCICLAGSLSFVVVTDLRMRLEREMHAAQEASSRDGGCLTAHLCLRSMWDALSPPITYLLVKNVILSPPFI